MALALAFVLLAGCQATPEQPVVIQKDLEQMIEKAAQTPEAAETPALPARYEAEFADSAKNITIHVDAAVVLPDTDAMPVLRVEKGEITQDIVDTLIRELVHGQLCRCDANGPFDQAGIQQQVLVLQAQLAAASADTRAAIEEAISTLQIKMQGAPAEPTPIPGQFEHPGEWSERTGKVETHERVQAVSGIGQSDAGFETFYAWKHQDSPQNSYVMYVREPDTAVGYSTGIGRYITREEAFDPNSDTVNKAEIDNLTLEQIGGIPDIGLTQEEAKTRADAVVEALGQDYMALYSAEKVYGGSYDGYLNQYGVSNPLRCVWRLRYMRTVNGAGITYTSTECGASEDELQASPWNYEDMVFYIDDSGIVGFEWKSPYQTADIAVQDANVISFDEAVNVFQNMLMVKYAMPEDQTIAFDINEIRFGLTRITEQNRRDSGLLVPVWDFFGSYVVTYRQYDGEQGTGMLDLPYTSLLTVNAIDGSIIDRSLGY
jgi:hypothetical protein